MLKKALLLKFCLLLVSVLFLQNTLAQDYTRWRLPKGTKARLGKGWTSEIQYSPDGTRLAVASSIGIWLYDTQTYQVVNLFIGHTGNVNSVAYSPDGVTLASGSTDTTIGLWDTVTGAHRPLTGHKGSVRSVKFSPDGRMLVSGSGRQGFVCGMSPRAPTSSHLAGIGLMPILSHSARMGEHWQVGLGE